MAFPGMQTSEESQISSTANSFYRQPTQQVEPYAFSTFHVLNNDSSHTKSQGTDISSQTHTNQFFTLESTPAVNYAVSNSPRSVSVSSNRIPFSPESSHSYASDMHNSSDNTYGSPLSGYSEVDDENRLMHAPWVLGNELPGPESDFDETFSLDGVVRPRFNRYNKVLEMAPHMDLKQLLVVCAEIVSEADALSLRERNAAISAAEAFMDVLEKKVSVSGEPLQRLGAYMLEGLRARLLSSGSIICKKLKCKEPASSELMSYMRVLSQIVPNYKFAYISANVIIRESMENERRIHIIDFQIAQGSQWVPFIQALSCRSSGPPCIRITGVDDSQSAHARGGGLELVGQKLAQVAKSCGVPFEFHSAAMTGSEVQLENLKVQHGEALAVNFPYVLHHMPDESVTTTNHRDRLLRLVKSLSPKVVTLIEQESNTNTGTFLQRFRETLDYYTAMFESIDAAGPRHDKLRISTEEHCVGRDVVNIIACEGTDRVERHELFGKWRSRLSMAGYSPVPLSPSVRGAVWNMLKEHSRDYRVEEANGAVYLGWKNRALATVSAWR